MSLTTRSKGIDNSRLLVGSLVTLAVAVVGNLVVGFVAKALFDIPDEFPPLGTLRYTVFTIVGVLGAISVYLFLGRRGGNPIRTFQRIGWIVLILSIIPDIGLWVGKPFPGTTLVSIIVLMIMHLVPGLAAIYLLPAMTKVR